jgi:hypothetical protein
LPHRYLQRRQADGSWGDDIALQITFFNRAGQQGS